MANEQTAAPITRRPRVGRVDRPRPDERILKQTGADMQNGWIARHGTLYLTDERLVFVPTPLDALLRGKRREIPLETITQIERWPEAPDGLPRDGRRPRIRLHAGEAASEYLVGDLDAWIDLLEVVFARRERRGEGAAPPVKRTGHVNILLEDD